MKKVDSVEEFEDELEGMPEEIDFSGAERGRYAGRFSSEVTMVLIERDVREVFPDSDAVNAALRMVMRAGVFAASEDALKARKAS